ncbi:MAG TPA: FAD-dependent oxidoreductase [Kofleriaceae bacterium]|nr:FAD-dependent oxidoreductase [Kofleriaceae bacterium]
MRQCEVVIAGAGVAGASLAYFLTRAGVRDVVVLEREGAPARHASGRSAEVLVEIEPDPTWQPLVAEGARFLRQPPPGFAPAPLLRATGELNLLGAGERDELAAALPALARQGIAVEILEPDEVRRRHPFITEPELAGASWLPGSGRIAVRALIAGYLDRAREAGAELWLDAGVSAVEREAGRVTGVVTARGPLGCRTLVCAAGAWAGELAALAGALPVRMQPLRRTVISFDAPAGTAVADWPLIADESRHIYVAPEGDGLLACPMDEDPIEPCDAQPHPAFIELARERLRRLAAPLSPAHIRSARAGLRTFAPDRRLVMGRDPVRPGFFWLAGQGGCGIETSPAVGRMAADLIARGATSDPELAAMLSPQRFA